MTIKFSLQGNFRESKGNPHPFNRMPWPRSQMVDGSWDYVQFKQYVREAYHKVAKPYVEDDIKTTFANRTEPIALRTLTATVDMAFYWNSRKAADALALYAAVCDALFPDLYVIAGGKFESHLMPDEPGRVEVTIIINDGKDEPIFERKSVAGPKAGKGNKNRAVSDRSKTVRTPEGGAGPVQPEHPGPDSNGAGRHSEGQPGDPAI